jgi:TonB family protein
MNKGKATCEVLKGIRLQIARENCIEYQTEECKFEGNCSGTCPKCEADIRFLEKELVKQNKLGKAVVIAGLSVGLLGGLTGCDSKKQEKEENSITPINESKSINDSIPLKTITKTPQDTLHPKCSSYNNNFILGSFEGGLELEEYPFRNDFIFDSIVENIDEIEGDIDRPVGLMETMPEFPGDMDSLKNFIKKELIYPENCKRDSISGVVLIGFVVEKDGTVTNVKAIMSAHPDLDAEAVRVIENMPKWKPGKQQGKPFRVSMQIPIRFSLQ